MRETHLGYQANDHVETSVTSVIKTPEWVKDAVFYQIFPDRFAKSGRVAKPSHLEAWNMPPSSQGFKGGDLCGVAEHLDYLEELGITAIYFNPIFQSASNHRYHTHDYYQVDPLLGGNAALRELLDAAHARGIRVVLDGVFNHASRGFFQFNHILECAEQSPYLDWFFIKGFPLNAYDYTKKPNYEAWVGLHALPKFNTDNPQVREYIWNVAVHWVGFGIDGWRLDVPAEIGDDSFWQEFRGRVKKANPDAYIVGEIWNEAQRWLQGDQFDAVMNYIQTRASISFFGAHSVAPLWHGGSWPPLKPLDAAGFATAIEDMLALYDWEITGAQMNLLSSHDTPRFINMVGEDQSALKLAMLFQMTMPGAPTVYYGDEIGLTGGYDPGCRAAMPWEREKWDAGLFNFVRETIALRKAHVGLRRGTYRTLLAEGEQYAFERAHDGERLVVAFNTAATAATLNLPVEQVAAPPRILFGDTQAAFQDGRLAIQAAPRAGVVIALD
jgi:cyclomaltodextrinase